MPGRSPSSSRKNSCACEKWSSGPIAVGTAAQKGAWRISEVERRAADAEAGTLLDICARIWTHFRTMLEATACWPLLGAILTGSPGLCQYRFAAF
jgi:hypothetical protein